MTAFKSSRQGLHSFFCFAILLSLLNTGFSFEIKQPASGSIEGYVFPNEAKARVELILPHPQNPEDTIHRTAIPNSSGYFKFNNVPAGDRRVIYFPKDPSAYKSASRGLNVVSAQTSNAGTVTLQHQ